MSPEKQGRYQAFMLRCWEVGYNENTDAAEWRFSIEEVRGGQPRTVEKLTELEMVFEYLKNRLVDDLELPKE